MIKTFGAFGLAAILAACGSGNPINGIPVVTGGTSNSLIETGSFGDSGIVDQPDFAPKATFDEATDTLQVDNMPFDGNGAYVRDAAVPSVGAFRVYQNTNTTERRDYRALYGETASGGARAVIVRTGSYRDFGFGGYIYQRDAAARLPSSGSATFNGDYGAMRTFDGRSGLTYTRGNASFEVDFLDFENQRATIEGFITNRQEFTQSGAYMGDLPVMILATSYANDNAEFTSSAVSYRDENGRRVDYESGRYYGVIAGRDASELIGIIVVNGAIPNDPDNVTFQETGVFTATTQN